MRSAEFIYDQVATAGLEYVFKYALTQEVAYHSILLERRKMLHKLAGSAIEELYAEHLDDHVVELPVND
jgi:predicted ATPase